MTASGSDRWSLNYRTSLDINLRPFLWTGKHKSKESEPKETVDEVEEEIKRLNLKESLPDLPPKKDKKVN